VTDSILDCTGREVDRDGGVVPSTSEPVATDASAAAGGGTVLRGLGALAGWFDYAGDCEMNEWQAREHILERVGVPGFIRGRRFEADGSHPRYFMLYETENVGVFTSAPYLERLNNPTEWSRRCAAGLANMTRSLCNVTMSMGDIDGGHVATAEILPGSSGDEVRGLLEQSLLAELIARPGIYAAHLLEADRAASGIATVEKRLRDSQDRVAEWILVIEGRDGAALDGGIAGVNVARRLRECGADVPAGWSAYRLSFSATADTAGHA
jgi:hypothetical protein